MSETRCLSGGHRSVSSRDPIAVPGVVAESGTLDLTWFRAVVVEVALLPIGQTTVAKSKKYLVLDPIAVDEIEKGTRAERCPRRSLTEDLERLNSVLI
jgi:hypothetical protein